MPGSWKRRGDSITITVSMGFDYLGKQVRYYKTMPYKSDKQADRESAIFYVECQQGKHKKPAYTLWGIYL